eukprot:CAMPEP_0201888906 /NCGR_PEP_ID=MMETSP0902-20130614/28694_1 /ASSEMBLY_ACC=CAM_ASM_000551 /TAXON_ID=420261 /ORGANISM="Thalassiosira antarctica, Strain CCMP982" /LENGTH=330 /DNA_ID=CAMNT_0048419301 /DNA_START=370 /DNA_END=1359 /DNA_ORIENTATION=+
MTEGEDALQVVCPRILVDGIAVIESTLASSEAFLLPEIVDIQTTLSVCSSVCAETGAVEFHTKGVDECASSLSTTDDKEQQHQQPQLFDVTVCSTTDQDQYPHLLSSLNDDDDHDRNRCALNTTAAEDDAPSYTSWSTVKVIHDTDDGSVEVFEVVSSITLSDFSTPQCHPSMFDFGQSLMPELTPRRRQHHSRVSCNEPHGRHHLSVIAPTPSRYVSKYRRPVDSLLLQKEHIAHDGHHNNPSPIPTHAILNLRDASLPRVRANTSPTPTPLKTNQSPMHARYQNESPKSAKKIQHYSNCGGYFSENYDPQSPRFRTRQEDKKGNVIVW